MAGRIHALLYDGPFSRLVDHEGVQVKLKAIGDGVIVYASRESAGASEFITVQSGPGGECSEFVGGSDGVSATPTAYREAELGEPRIESALQGPHHGRGDAGGVPVHTRSEEHTS